jgi:squalene-hopene/tetraprenyl-beta-curcumene cyclase
MDTVEPPLDKHSSNFWSEPVEIIVLQGLWVNIPLLGDSASRLSPAVLHYAASVPSDCKRCEARMPTQNVQQPISLDQGSSDQLDQAIAAAQGYLLSIQKPEGYWWADLESNVTITAEIILLHKIWGTDRDRPLAKAEQYLRSHQRDHGGWELFYGDGGDLSTSVEAYTALRVLGVPASDPDLLRAKDFILSRGGISKTRIFTKFHLALIGCYDWQGLPSLPAWVMLLESPSPFTIYELSSWARGSTVPLLVVFDQKPVYAIEPAIKVDELYAEGIKNVRWELPQNGDWSDIFLWLDKGFKLAESMNLIPFRKRGFARLRTGFWNGRRPRGTGVGLSPPCSTPCWPCGCWATT